MKWFYNVGNNASNVLIRVLVGSIFFSEGLQKFLFSSELGVGRFIKIGLPMSEILAPTVGVVEIVCGIFLIIGFLSRLMLIPLGFVISFAIISTKIPMLFSKGVWVMLHESRTDFSMLTCIIFLLISGSGAYSVDKYLGTSK